MNVKKIGRKHIMLCGSILMVLGYFMPLAQTKNILGSQSVCAYELGVEGFIIIAIMVSAVICALFSHLVPSFVFGVTAMAGMAYQASLYFPKYQYESLFNKYDSFFGELNDLVSMDITLGAGIYIAMLGLVVMAVGFFMRKKAETWDGKMVQLGTENEGPA